MLVAEDKGAPGGEPVAEAGASEEGVQATGVGDGVRRNDSARQVGRETKTNRHDGP